MFVFSIHPHGVKRLGFSQHAYVEVFKETELRFEANEAGAAALRAQTEYVETVPCLPSAEETTQTVDAT